MSGHRCSTSRRSTSPTATSRRCSASISTSLARETVSIIGANGAGKSTLLKAIVGLVPIGSGAVTYAGTSLAALSAPRRVEQGISLVPEGRRIFPSLTVEENLAVGLVLEAKGPVEHRASRRRLPAARAVAEAQQRGAVGR